MSRLLRIMIADDEPKIRSGLRNFINNKCSGMEIVGEAEDGAIALEMAKELKPDILLVDICMPFMDGLELVDALNAFLTETIIIVITGHDKFSYAQQALKLKVFDYLVKPVPPHQLKSVLDRAIMEFHENRKKTRYMEWADLQVEKNMPVLRERFLNEWIHGNLTQKELEDQLEFFKTNIHRCSGVLVVKVAGSQDAKGTLEDWDWELLLFAIQNIVEELLENMSPNVVFKDNKGNIVAVFHGSDKIKETEIAAQIQETIKTYLHQSVEVSAKGVSEDVTDIPKIYENLLTDIQKKNSYSPVILQAHKYLETNYHQYELSLQGVAKKFSMSPTYLSRLFKHETGLSFIDCLTRVRMMKAIQLMNDKNLKIHEIAERIGYGTQHYFSTSFKKSLGVSPADYRKGKRKVH